MNSYRSTPHRLTVQFTINIPPTIAVITTGIKSASDFPAVTLTATRVGVGAFTIESGSPFFMPRGNDNTITIFETPMIDSAQYLLPYYSGVLLSFRYLKFFGQSNILQLYFYDSAFALSDTAHQINLYISVFP